MSGITVYVSVVTNILWDLILYYVLSLSMIWFHLIYILFQTDTASDPSFIYFFLNIYMKGFW